MKNLLSLLILLSCFQAQAQVPSYFPTNGLRSAHLFSGNAADNSGNGNNGAVTNATLTTDRFGMPNAAYYFNGVSSYINIPGSSSLDFTNNSFSMSAWIKATTYNPTSEKVIAWRGDAPAAFDPYLLYIAGGQIKFRRDVGFGTTTNEIGFPTTGIDASKWHFVVGTYDSATSTMSLYFDGALVQQQVKPGIVNYSTSSFANMIGNATGGTSTVFSGELDELGLWNRALSACEVSRLFHSKASFITANPQGQVVTAGSNASFTIGEIANASSYQWQVNTGSGFANIPGGTAKTLTIPSATVAMNNYDYRVIRNGQSCPDTSAAAKLVVWSTNVENVSENYGIRVYPNPANDYISISLPANIAQSEVALFDALGQIVLMQTIKGTENISLDHVAAGVYVLKINFNDKVLIQKITRE